MTITFAFLVEWNFSGLEIRNLFQSIKKLKWLAIFNKKRLIVISKISILLKQYKQVKF
jgi:hypothetical protein